MRQVTVFGSGKYFNKLQTIELQVSFSGEGGVSVVKLGEDVATVRARVAAGAKNWPKYAGDTLEALGKAYVDTYGDVPGDEMFDAWHAATAIVWKRALMVET